MMNRFIKILTVMLISSGVGGFILFLLLPVLFDTWVVPKILEKLPFNAKELSISKITPWKIRGTVTLSQNDTLAFAIPRFEVHYSPRSLINKEIETLLLDSLYVHLTLRDGKIGLGGFSSDKSGDEKDTKNSALLLHLAPRKIVLRNCNLVLHDPEKVPKKKIFSFNSTFVLNYGNVPNGPKEISSIDGEFFAYGDLSLQSTVHAEFKDGIQTIQIDASLPSLEQMAKVTSSSSVKQLSGSARVDANISLENLSRLAGYNANIEISDFDALVNGRIFSATANQPVKIAIKGDLKKSQFTVSDLQLTEPEKIKIDLEGVLSISDLILKGTGKAKLPAIAGPTTFDFSYVAQKGTSSTSLDIDLAGEPSIFSGKYQLGKLHLKTNVFIEGSKITGTVLGNLDSAAFPELEIEVNKVNFSMPFQLPFTEASINEKGYLNIDRISYKKTDVASVNTVLKQSGNGLGFTSTIAIPFVEELSLKCDGKLAPTPFIDARCSLKETEFDSSTFPPFLGIPENFSVTGTLSLNSRINYINSNTGGQLTINLSGAEIESGETQLSGISTSIHIPELDRFASSPGQIGTVDFINFGNITMTDARIRYRIENTETLFLEKARLSWCGGKVEMGSISINSKMEQLETTLYCDRIGFTALLNQFGIEGTEGEGSLNGKLPVAIDKGAITFDDGFLFSTPGNGGIIKFNNTEELRQGLPGIEATPYLDYSMKALENFSYNWTKLTFKTVDKDLVLAMQLDGKPTTPLPFGYKNGQIISTKKGQGLQHPIRLDVNFKLPLQELFQYGKNFQSLMENM